MKLYIAGPMTGIEDFNFPAFNAAAKRWRSHGHTVINPAENAHGDTSKPWAYYIRQDIAHVLNVEAVAVLSGWQKSRGATLEVSLARALDLPILDADTLEPFDETILSATSNGRARACGSATATTPGRTTSRSSGTAPTSPSRPDTGSGPARTDTRPAGMVSLRRGAVEPTSTPGSAGRVCRRRGTGGCAL